MKPPMKKKSSAMAELGCFTLLLLLLLIIYVQPSSGECTPDSLPNSLPRVWRSSSRAWALSLHGRINSSTSPSTLSTFLSGEFPTDFTLDVSHSETTQVISGTIHLSRQDFTATSTTTTTTTTAKGWNPRFNHGWRPRLVRGTVSGIFDPDSNSICAKVCLRRLANFTTRSCTDALLTLQYPVVRSIDSLFVVGELRSLVGVPDPNYFSPLLLTGVSNQQYNYTKVAVAGRYCSAVKPDGDGPMLRDLRGNSSVCQSGLRSVTLNFTRTCAGCYPFFDDRGSSTVYFSRLSCGFEGVVSGFLQLDGYGGRGFHVGGGKNVLAVEGKWDEDRLCMVACQTETVSGVRDCSMLVTLQYPQEFSMHQRSPIIGSLRSMREKSDPLFFVPFTFGAGGQMYRFYTHVRARFGYAYTKLDEAAKQCGGGSGKVAGEYPSGAYFEDFFFQSTSSSRGRNFNVYQVSLNNRLSWSDGFYGSSSVVLTDDMPAVTAPKVKENVNVSFDITVDKEYITAEGFYDPNRGMACMMGCKAVNASDSRNTGLEHGKDCKIFVKIQYPPASGKPGNRKISATITSLRKKKEALYFKPITLTSYQSMYMAEASESIWMKDLEIFLSMLTLSLVLVVLVFQLLHARRQPKLRPYASLLMLFILALGHMVPLLLNFEAFFSSENSSSSNRSYGLESPLSSGGSFLQVKEVAIRVMNMMAFLLLLWLLQLVWNSRNSETAESSSSPSAELSRFSEDAGLLVEEKKDEYVENSEVCKIQLAAVGERNVLLVCLPLYVVGAVATSFRQWLLHKSLWSGLKAYAGLSLDLFLVPQVLAYSLWGLKVQALSAAFCVGMTIARLLPHAFDIYRVFRPSLDVGVVDYYFANREWDFFSLAWDIVIPCAAFVIALLVLLQQRFGGRCFIPNNILAR